MFERSEVHMAFSVENQRITGIGLLECFIGVLPESIGKLKSLQLLHLIGNKLKTLLESITKLKSLQHLYLDTNQLKTLPESIFRLTTLKRLNLSNNPLARKPDSRTKSILKQLKKNNIDIYV